MQSVVTMCRFQTTVPHNYNVAKRQCNSRGVAVRSVDEIKKKWKAVKSDTTQATKSQKKMRGGPEEKPPIYADFMFSIIR